MRILLGGDVSFDPEIRTRPYLGLYALKKKSDPNIRMICSQNGCYFRDETARTEVRAKKVLDTLRRILHYLQRMLIRRIILPEFYPREQEFPRELSVRATLYQETTYIRPQYKTVCRWNIPYPSFDKRGFSYPFEKISHFLQQKDLVWINLETPLTSHSRPYGLFIGDPEYAGAMRQAGVTAVSLANNHTFDAGEVGFLHTLEHLTNAGILYVGAGNNLAEAREGKLIELSGVRLVLLSYTQFCSLNFTSIASQHAGVLPMDRQLMTEDIRSARQKADFVFVALHWGIEEDPMVRPEQVDIAHSLIDSGADGVIGHHPHVQQAIEIYRKRPILYSLGNFIFAQGDTRWRHDNMLAEIVIDEKAIQGVILYPISGQGSELFQPALLSGDRAHSVLRELQVKSAIFNTGVYIDNNAGYIKIDG